MKTYLDYFKEISSIPRASHNTDKITKYLVSFASEHNFEHYSDDAGNVIIIKEASKGMEDKETIIIQGHSDMVAVKDPEVDIDLSKDGLRLKTDGDYLYAEGTSLGADDGIAVAYGLALLSDESLALPRIELIITTDEEVGMLGATALKLTGVTGHTMLNIDSEDEGIFFAGCAGGARVDITYPLKPLSEDEINGLTAYKIVISGLIGGHSGTEIHRGRANAIMLMARIISKLSDGRIIAGIEDIKGGTADNAICDYCEMTVLCKSIEPELFDIIKFEVLEPYMAVEKDARISIEETDRTGSVYKLFDSGFDHFVLGNGDGVVSMSRNIEGLVETSLNHGIVSMEDGKINLAISVRSEIDSKRDELVYSITDKAFSYGAYFRVHGEYPGWAYRQDSPLQRRMVSLYEKMFNEKPSVMTLHAGLECGVFASKIDNFDAVSFGPKISDIHTTKERLSLSSAERIWQFIVKLLTEN